MKKIILPLILFACIGFQKASSQNLMTNGSFENFLPPCPTAAPNGAFNQVLDWKPANDIPGLGTPHAELFCGEPNYGGCLPGPVPNVGSDGIAYVGFHTRIFSPPYNESIYQVLATPLITGNTYTISFDLMDCQSGFFITGMSDFCVYTNIDTIVPACPPDNPSVTVVGCIPFDSISNTAWKHHEFSFVAPPNSNIIAFSGAACNIAEIYYYLDNVVLTTQAVNAQFTSADNHICPGTCTDFTSLSSNATSWQWTFTGASPSIDTSENPSNICYNTPGTYAVTLIASNSTASDTLTLNNYITVYPSPPPQGISQSGDTLIANAGAVSYQWYYNGNPVPGATDYFYVAPTSGDYNVVATDGNGCEVEAVIFNVLASVQSMVNDHWSMEVYPNPVDESLTVISHSPYATVFAISIYNSIGEKIFSRICSPDEKTISIPFEDFGSGIYLVRIATGAKTFFKKVVKE